MSVKLATVRSYDREAITDALSVTIEALGGLTALLGTAKTLLLKPNFVVPEMKPSNTHPEFYMAVADFFQAAGYTVSIGESPAFGTAESALVAHGIKEECEEKGIRMFSFKKSIAFDGVPGHKHYKRLSIASELKDYDAIINLPKVKVHSQFVFTGATKNCFGCVVGKRKTFRHVVSGNDVEDFSRMIHLTAKRVSPALTIADGIVALHKNGPRRGAPFALERILVGDNYLEMDWIIAIMIGLEPEETPLFSVLSQAERDVLRASCEAIIADSAPLPDIKRFRQALPTPIEFTLPRMAKSVLKNIKQGAWRVKRPPSRKG